MISRPFKRGGTQEYQTEYQKGFRKINADELDADLDQLYDSWNSGTLQPLLMIGPSPPTNPQVGQMWFRSDPDGRLYIYYDDGTSQQWVSATVT